MSIVIGAYILHCCRLWHAPTRDVFVQVLQLPHSDWCTLCVLLPMVGCTNQKGALLLLLLLLISLIGWHYTRIWRSFAFYGLLSRGRTQV